jgi:phosphatidylserine decarboxylase
LASRKYCFLISTSAMKKVFGLQVIACWVAFVAGTSLGFDLPQIALFAWLPILVAGYLWLWWFRTVFFFRDPERLIPQGDSLVLSPADGRVMYLHPVKAGEVISNKQGQKIRIAELAKTPITDTDGWLLGIYMTPFDVHYNRAPLDGEITTLHYHRTDANLPMVDLWEYVNFTVLRRAVDLFTARFHLENERMTMQIANAKVTCFLILIADRFVNKISRFFREGQAVRKGQKISFIQRGSQTDLFIASERLSFEVRPGDQVYAGKTIIARLERP